MLGKNLRADVDPLNDTNFYTPNLFGLWVAPGFKDSSHYTAYLLEGGLEMASREYYLESNDNMRKLQAEYRTHVATMLRLAGFDDVENRATRILEVERAIAQKHTSLAEDEDIHRTNNPWNQSDFSSKAPGLDWQGYFQGAGLGDVANIIAAFHKRIEGLAWMKEQTKAEAQRKLSALYVGIGYPEVWRDYSGYRVEENDIFGNLWRSRWFEYQLQVSRLGKAVDRQEWAMTPQTANAVNLPLQNAINFPAAILEPPFFDPQAPDADNYGAIGNRYRPRNQPHLRFRGQRL